MRANVYCGNLLWQSVLTLRDPKFVSLVVCSFVAVFAARAGGAVPFPQDPADGATVATLNATQKAYYARTLAERQAVDSETSAPPTGVRKALMEDGTSFPLKTTFAWSGSGPFQLVIRRAADRVVFFSTNGLSATSLAVGNFKIGCRYVWSVGNASGFSAERTFATEPDGPRLLDGASEIFCTNVWAAGKSYEYRFSNPTPHGVRDIGGVTGLDGRRVRQGMIIRSSQLDSEYSASGTTSYITDRNRAFWKEFIGIKTEIDLRNATESKLTASPLGPDVTYRHFASMTAYAEYLQGSSVKNNVRDIVKLFADEANYPIDFHCVHGKDRTGAVALILEGLLGCSEDHIARDYQATMFWNPLQASARFFALENYFRTNRYANASNVSLNEGIYNYVKKVGVTADEIDAFREIMLEPAAKRWTGKTVAVVGDSYSAWEGAAGVTNAYYPSAECGVTQKAQMWWSQVIASYDGTPGVVAAGSGSRIAEDCVSGGVPMGSFENRVKDGQLGDPDVILVLGGLNDWWHELPTADFHAACGSLFDTLDTRYAKAEKIVLLSKLPDMWDVGIPDDYRRALRTAALARDYAVVDLEGAYNASGNVKEGHPTALGMTNIAHRVVATLEGAYVAPELPPYVPPSEPGQVRPRYLQTDGKGWIDLGFRPHLRNTLVEVVSTVDAGTANANALAWAHSDETAANFYRIGYAFWPSDGHFSYYVSTGSYKEMSHSCDGLDVPADRPGVHTILFGGTNFVVDGVRVLVAEMPDDHLSGDTLQLFVTREDNYQHGPTVKLYSVKVWNVEGTETNLVHHFLPTETGASLYDRTNPSVASLVVRGTGANFTVGTDEAIEVPSCSASFEYDGTEKRFPLEDTDTYTVLGEKAATVPGTYVARIVPNGGYCWEDGTHAVREFEWSVVGTWSPVGTAYGVSNRVSVACTDYCILSFTNTSAGGFAWTVPKGVTNFDFLVVAGGGGGGAGNSSKSYCRKGGGGGAGGVVTGRVANASGTFTVKVGAGGTRGASLGANGAKGGDSSLSLGDVDYVIARGGGFGGGARYASTTDTGNAGGSGGSGGGGSSRNGSGTWDGGAREEPLVGSGVAAYESFGNAGGRGSGKATAGGGGGAGGAGGDSAADGAGAERASV